MFYLFGAALAGFTASLVAIFIFIAIRARRLKKPSWTVALYVSVALVLALGTGWLIPVAYHEDVTEYPWFYDYSLDVSPNATSPQAIVVPIPQDTSIIAGLQLSSGIANWSFADTFHGRGLYVQFTGQTILHSAFSEYPSSGHNTTMTMTTFGSVYGYPKSVWVYYVGSDGARLFLSFGSLRGSGVFMVQQDPLVAGWNLCQNISVAIP